MLPSIAVARVYMEAFDDAFTGRVRPADRPSALTRVRHRMGRRSR
jgi:hypothetical protein